MPHGKGRRILTIKRHDEDEDDADVLSALVPINSQWRVIRRFTAAHRTGVQIVPVFSYNNSKTVRSRLDREISWDKTTRLKMSAGYKRIRYEVV